MVFEVTVLSSDRSAFQALGGRSNDERSTPDCMALYDFIIVLERAYIFVWRIKLRATSR